MTSNLPVGIETHLVADQPHVVEEAVGEFIKTLIEAVAIVLAVSFLSLGWRPGSSSRSPFRWFSPSLSPSCI